jgi:protocatechuate 3,4-dioxygenase beta subunit
LSNSTDLTRRGFLRIGLAVPASLVAVAASGQILGTISHGRGASAQELPLTPECSDEPQATRSQTEGPYFTRNSPERTSLLEPGVDGTRLVVTGSVVSRACQPIAGALLDFWQADANGAYDNVGYRMRGHQYTNDAGRFELETVVPGLYPGRTRHIHVKVQAPNGPVLTTQLYFPDEPRNARDGIYTPALLMAVQEVEGSQWGSYNFVVNAA